jgi:hypothetical protein
MGARGSLVVTAYVTPEGRGSRGEFFSIYLILPAVLGRGIYSSSNINEYQKQKKSMFLESKVRLCVGLTTLLPSGSRLFRQCGTLNISHPYRPPPPVKGIDSFAFTACFGYSFF